MLGPHQHPPGASPLPPWGNEDRHLTCLTRSWAAWPGLVLAGTWEGPRFTDTENCFKIRTLPIKAPCSSSPFLLLSCVQAQGLHREGPRSKGAGRCWGGGTWRSRGLLPRHSSKYYQLQRALAMHSRCNRPGADLWPGMSALGRRGLASARQISLKRGSFSG